MAYFHESRYEGHSIQTASDLFLLILCFKIQDEVGPYDIGVLMLNAFILCQKCRALKCNMIIPMQRSSA
jgi:hypothetical protein